MVSVPLRGLDMWKPEELQAGDLVDLVSVPLRGLDMWKLNTQVLQSSPNKSCFSPLAGIRYVETASNNLPKAQVTLVSVPLRGLDMWKPKEYYLLES